MWDSFISGFCKVAFLCYAGDPNWLGWIVLVIFALIIFAIGFALVTAPRDKREFRR